MRFIRPGLNLASVFALVVLTGAPRILAQSNTPRERFTAVAVNISNVGRTGATPVDIVIDRWTTDSERDNLVTIFKKKGPEALLNELQGLRRVGTISTPGSLAYDLHFARELPGEDGGRRIVLATDRPMGFFEVSRRARTVDYPFTLIDLRLDKDGRGEGKLAIAAKLTLNQDVLVIEDYADQPVMLNEVKKTK
jgi:hypothetical protein